MFKKVIISIFILLTLFININVYAATSQENEEDIKNITQNYINKLFTDVVLKNIKDAYDENIGVHYNKMAIWFEENIKPKIENTLNKVISSEEYSKEKEELKNELPDIFSKLSNFFKNFNK